MPRIGITGHMNLAPATVVLVREALQAALEPYGPAELVGVSCIAEGADSIFAAVLLDAGGRLEALLPTPDYRDTQVSAAHLPVFDGLVQRAHVKRYIAKASSMQAYEDANAQMLSSVDLLLAVWDGQPSPEGKKGGTADAVAVARNAGVPVTVIWPEGAERT
ncbi:hypothetical protein O1R50_22320 [Glycomyces luteolus]|uniref:Uncharacterized protein n=1 Tax=Glycomyces luteolus TaxID=2670330 RepID=A0A9X3PC52_9ACTN|nr:hypothetical protein [Glycomyces luteolus]MDA1362377.1 hypothetical protein [Glycomyces luteolus]